MLVDGSTAGSGNLEILVNGGHVTSYVRELGDQCFMASFVPHQAVVHSIDMKFNGETVKGTVSSTSSCVKCSAVQYSKRSSDSLTRPNLIFPHVCLFLINLKGAEKEREENGFCIFPYLYWSFYSSSLPVRPVYLPFFFVAAFLSFLSPPPLPPHPTCAAVALNSLSSSVHTVSLVSTELLHLTHFSTCFCGVNEYLNIL